MARPNPPGVSSTPSGRGFLFLLQILRGARRLSRRKKLARVPAARGERGAKASADGARRASRGRRAGVECQDGKCKAATQAHHGSGRVHCHSLGRQTRRSRLAQWVLHKRARCPAKMWRRRSWSWRPWELPRSSRSFFRSFSSLQRRLTLNVIRHFGLSVAWLSLTPGNCRKSPVKTRTGIRSNCPASS